MKLVSTAQMRALEQAAVDSGATWSGLMEQAGWGVAREVMQALGVVTGRFVLVLVGPGNNGGDGLVAARHLRDASAHVALYVWNRRDSPADVNRQRCRERDIAGHDVRDDPRLATLQRLLDRADVVLDALLGMGVNRPVAGDLAAIIAAVNQSRRRSPPPLVVSIDLPTGIDSDSGAVYGSAIEADLTVATGLTKHGLLFFPGRSHAGTIRVADIGLASADTEAIMSETIDRQGVYGLLPARPADSHKGTFGKVMVVAGSLFYPGAATLATAGAARVGAGLVTLASGRSSLGAPGRLPEITLRPLPEAELGAIGEQAADELFEHLESYDALLVGPGLGREKPIRLFLERLLGIEAQRHRSAIGFRIGGEEARPTEKKRPLLPPAVLDADALNLLSEIETWWERLPGVSCVLTPHPGEMKRLLKVEQLDNDLVKVATEAAAQWNQIVVLKGATTVVAEPEGRTAVSADGNPALATAGTGDVLAGAITGLLAQGLTPYDAAVLGVYLHRAAGELVRDEMGDAGTLASDLLLRLPRAIRELRATGR